MIAVRDCMRANPPEKVLVVTDQPLRTIGYALRQAARDLDTEVLLVEIVPRKSNGEEPPPEVAELMKMVDVVLCPTSKSLSQTDSRRAASACGVRIATPPGVTEEIMVRCRNADYDRIAQLTYRLCELMEGTRLIRVQSPSGTDILLPVEGRKAHASSGILQERGRYGNLPTGEAYLAPLEGRPRGILVVDGSMAGVGLLKEPIRIIVENGCATGITGGEETGRLVELLEPHGKDARPVAEFGIGTNDRAVLTGNILEDERVLGKIHIAFGDNKSMGLTVRVAKHLDGMANRPTVWFDERKIMEAGSLLI